MCQQKNVPIVDALGWIQAITKDSRGVRDALLGKRNQHFSEHVGESNRKFIDHLKKLLVKKYYPEEAEEQEKKGREKRVEEIAKEVLRQLFAEDLVEDMFERLDLEEFIESHDDNQ